MKILFILALALPAMGATGDFKIQQRSAAGSFPDQIFATANNGVWITSSGGAAAIATTLPSAVQNNITAVGTIASGTWHGTAVEGQYGGTGVANTGKTITLGGNFTTSGAFALILTVTAGTNVTLPISGTLATAAATVPSVAGTSNQVLVNGSTAAVAGSAVTLSLATDLASVNSVTAAAASAFTLSGGNGGANIVLAKDGNGSATLTAPGTGEVTTSARVTGLRGSSDPTLRIYRSLGGSEWLDFTGSNGGWKGANNEYDIDQTGTNRRAVKFRYSSDGSSFTTSWTWTPATGISIEESTVSTTSGTGAFVVTGGLGVGGAVNTASSITTGTPNGGTAAAWKLGVAVTGQTLVLDTTKYLQLDIGGTLYKVMTAQ